MPDSDTSHPVQLGIGSGGRHHQGHLVEIRPNCRIVTWRRHGYVPFDQYQHFVRVISFDEFN